VSKGQFNERDYKAPADRSSKTSLKPPPATVRIDDRGRDKQGRVRGKATVSLGYMNRLRRMLRVANDPLRQNGKVKSLADMTPEERAAIEARYGAKIK
jgi:hypothetical protein